MKKRYVVKLSVNERDYLEGILKRGREAAYRRRHAEVLLLVDEGKHGDALTDNEAAERTSFCRRIVEQLRERCVTEGLKAALERKPRRRDRTKRLDGEGEAQLVKLACSKAPEGRVRWTLRLLADKLIELEVVETISMECVRQVLKKHDQTVASGNVVYSTEGRRRLRLCDGASA